VQHQPVAHLQFCREGIDRQHRTVIE
jgi:hypothetical protein